MKHKRSLVSGNAYVDATFNNVHFTITDYQGNVQGWATSGSVGFKGNKKSTTYAAQCVANSLMGRMKRFGLRTLHFYLKGSLQVRDAIVSAVRNSGVTVVSVEDRTPVAHGGVRLRRARRT